MLAVLDKFSGGELLLGGFVVVIIIAVLGAITNALLGEAGFGTVVNGLMMTLGAVAGIALRSVTLGFQ